MLDKIKKKVIDLWKKGLVIIFIGSFCTKLISYFGSIFLIRVLSKADYGILTYLENIYGYFWVVAGMGMCNSTLRYIVKTDSINKKASLFNYTLKMAFIWNIGLIVFGFIFNLIYPHPSVYEDYSWLLMIILMGLPFQYTNECVYSNERAMFSNNRYTLISLTTTFFVILFKVIFGRQFGINGAIFSQAITYLALASFFFINTKKKYYKSCDFYPISKEEKKDINGYSIQYMITNGLWAIFMLNDIFLLGRFAAPEVLADYKVAYVLPGCVSIIGSSIGVFVSPYFSKNEKNIPWIRENYKKTLIASAGAVGLVCLGIGVLSRWLVILFYTKEYISVVPVMNILLIAAFLNNGLRYTTANILASMGEVKYNMIISIIGMILQIGINLYAIPKYGINGVAYTSCLVYLIMGVSLFVIFYKKYYSKKN